MIDTKLILIEGCPGSGKSSTAQHIGRQLQAGLVPCRWYYEEEQPHPTAVRMGIHDPKGFRAFGRETLRTWRDFVSRAQRSDDVTIIESHLFQDIIDPLVRANVKSTRIVKLVQRMMEFCEPLNPVLIYLHQPDYASTMRRILDERGKRIETQYISRAESSRFGRRHKLQGFDGLVQMWVRIRTQMEELFDGFDTPKLSIDNTARDWPTYYGQISELLQQEFESTPELGADQLNEFAGTYTYTKNAAPRRAGGVTRFGADNVQRRVAGLPRQVPLHHQKELEFTLAVEKGELVLRDYGWLWPTSTLIPVKRDVFDLRSWPFQMVFDRDKSGAVVGMMRKSETTKWQITGQRYRRKQETE